MQWIQDQSQSNVDILNNVRREVSRHFRDKKKAYLRASIEELETNSKIQNTCIETSMNLRRGIARSKLDGTCAETSFHLSTKRTSPFKFAGGGGGQFSRLLAAEVCASAVVMRDIPCSEVV